LPVTVASGERLFLKVNKKFCLTVSQKKLTNMATISIEHEIARIRNVETY